MYETLLVATDGSDESKTAIEHALDLATDAGATVYVLAVVDVGNPLQFGVEEVAELDEAASEMVEDIVAVYDDGEVEIHGDVRRGKPVSEILERADEVGADLILAGQHGGDSLSDVLLGSTTERLSALTDIPVVVVPESD